MHKSTLALSPEEDVVAGILDENEDVDDSLPADLWFRQTSQKPRNVTSRGISRT